MALAMPLQVTKWAMARATRVVVTKTPLLPLPLSLPPLLPLMRCPLLGIRGVYGKRAAYKQDIVSVDYLRLINLKGKKFVYGGGKNSNRTDHTLIERLF
jgi:hypothetical protein